ncbi:lysophospholipase [Gautieria morchelliformis]|nr:lysophospholipase [Gautieria morchelliformis]
MPMADVFEEAWLPGPAGTEFYTRTYVPPTAVKAVLVFVHGFIEHIGRYEHVFPFYVQSGIAVFAFDQRGFGRTALDAGPDGQRQREREARNEGYGRTSSQQQKEDISWAVQHAGETLAGWSNEGATIPMFLMGHSMGGALVLSFCTTARYSPLHPLAGVIATSPLIAQRHPASKLVRKFGGAIGLLSPWTTVPAGVVPDHLSHDKAVAELYLKDPLVKQFGTLKGVSSMLNLGDDLSSQDYGSWPVKLPVLLVHGTDDQVTSPAATGKFHLDVTARDKAFIAYQDGFHELHNEPEFAERLKHDITTWIEKHITPSVSVSGSSEAPDARL